MQNIYSIDGIIPVVHPTAYIHPTAVLIGDVIIGPGVYVGPLASLRGDYGRIEMKAGSNVQDGCVIHGTYRQDTVVHEDGHIGHAAVLHGCTIGVNVLVGMNAVVMDHADVGANSIIGAQAFVKKGMQIPPYSLVTGAPAQIIRQLDQATIDRKHFGTRLYQRLAQRCLQSMEQVEPLTAPEPDRRRLTTDMIFPLE
ncbi:phenylacetic acid degradation protein PaaY [Alcaligenes endophyticus]|uniref:Phenylacetic acid degradation protein PaaY n=1 Tax=Alcaligenes endophyticus TaxID=1929088 RepID=A0ABT8EN23_9BURK|nr:phenylacetic acid degradation protein PaaY [Alcaligenes endophyticus]MCX5591415.1 phenylacetic acid degradation protein PaaY [Alcaligenes endophyticus]MDN4122704.1 phenylacetic acid degradation protein PaaY [Alcaligenes endophyticus]